MGGMMTGTPAGFTVLWALAGIAVVGLAVTAALWLIRSMTGGKPPEIGADNRPVDILRRRYAAGDIDEDEYLRRLSGLSQR